MFSQIISQAFFPIRIVTSQNDLSGSMPTSYTQLLMLRELDLRGNPRMQGNIAQSYLKTDYSQMTKQTMTKQTPSDDYACPLIRFKHNNGVVRVDPGYFHRKYCYCDVDYYGTGGFCLPCLANAKCPGVSQRDKTTFKHAPILTEMRISKGAWPFSK